jgi:uncharacterized membrane protein
MPRRAFRCSLYAALAAAVLSCSPEPTAPTRLSDPPTALAAKSATALAVKSASPPFGDQGTTVDIHVLGTGFTSGATATWLLHGAADPTHVRTNKTTFVSSTELVANITIASDAQLAFWDVQVALLGGKNGVGSEAFEVTAAQILGNGTLGGDANVQGMNDLLQVVGYSSGSAITPFVFDDALGMVNLGTGQAWGIDPLGTMVFGHDATYAVAWVRQPNNSWLPQYLPRTSTSVGGNASSAARAADGTLLVAGWDGVPGAKRSDPSFNRPVLWRHSASGWTAPQILTLPAGATKGSARDVNGLGQVVGQINAVQLGAAWDTPTTPVQLDGIANAINEAGTIVVGQRNSAPVYWLRSASGAWNPTGIPLPSIAGASCVTGGANGVNSAGAIVGASCNSGGKQQATAWLLDLTASPPKLNGAPTALPGLGDKTSATVSSATGVTETAPYTAAGGAVLNGVRLAVRWRLQ